MSKIQYYGIKFPFTAERTEKRFVDLNGGGLAYVKSQIMHLIFTVKGTKLRDPDYGTNLIKYIFDENIDETWSSIKEECKKAISKYVYGCNLIDIQVAKNEEDDHDIYVKINFSTTIDGKSTNDSIVTKI
jgi:phage baseplate assembly protein W